VTKREAAKAAYVHFIAKLHASGALKDVFPADEGRLDQQTMHAEAGAKVDIYNYSARFSLIPKFLIRKLPRLTRSRGKAQVEVTIELEEQNIKVVARGPELKRAEISASIRFKQEAEKYHAEHGDRTLIIKDAASLNIGNILDFLDFYKMFYNEDLQASMETTTEFKIDGGNLWKAQALMKGEKLGPPVLLANKKAAEQLAYLVGAVTLIQDDPKILREFQNALSNSVSGKILRPVKPIDMDVDTNAALIMQETLQEARRAGLPDRKEDIASDETQVDVSPLQYRKTLLPQELEQKSQSLKRAQREFEQDPKLSNLRAMKAALPMSQYRKQVLKHISGSTYCVIVGATGSGKTTQVPQILLEDAISKDIGAKCNIICTQPRRIAATSVARRVADERNEQLRGTVGYHVRFDVKLPQIGGSILYCTTGILLQQLQRSPDEVLESVSHIVIDEVHERDILIDFLMIIIKKNMHARRLAGKHVPKVVLMSATIDSELFAKYFEEKTVGGKVLPCPSLSVPGRTFPVKEKYFDTIMTELEQAYRGPFHEFIRTDRATEPYVQLERSFSQSNSSSQADENVAAEATIDWKRQVTTTADGQTIDESEDAMVPVALVAATIAHITKISNDGAILAFLPGYDEIKNVMNLLTDKSPLGVNFLDPGQFKLFMLHSSVPAAEQADVFNPVPAGCRKIILSTNIAETSVTIPDIQYVVDTGKLREKRYDQIRRITKLQCTWISKSNATQRAGRAGRVRDGNYYALYSRARYESLRAVGLPEMLRSDLQEICLAIKAQSFKAPIRDFLSEAIEPPPSDAVNRSVMNLQSLEALTDDEQLTALGRLLASLPVHPSLGKMMVLGVIFRCLDPMIILGAILNERALFVAPLEKRAAAYEAQSHFMEKTSSDHYALINAFRQMRLIRDTKGLYAMQEFAYKNFCHIGAFKTLDQTTKQIEEILVEHGIIPYIDRRDRFEGELGHPALNQNSTNVTLFRALALAGTNPNLAVCTGGRTFRTPGEKFALLHPSSLNHKRFSDKKSENEPSFSALYSYSSMQNSNDGKNIFLRDTTLSTPLMATLFGGKITANGNILEMDGWLKFYVHAQPRVIKTVMEFRKALDRLLTAAFSDLATLRTHNRNRNMNGDRHQSGGYLADDAVREAFASGLVEVLNNDAYKTPPRLPDRKSRLKADSKSIDSGVAAHLSGHASANRAHIDTFGSLLKGNKMKIGR